MAKGTGTGQPWRMHIKAVADLVEKKYRRVLADDFFTRRGEGEPIFAERCRIGVDIYGKERCADIILFHPRKWPDSLVIRCKWQVKGGTADQKYPFEVLSIEKNGIDTIIVLDGGGYTPGAEKWLQDQAGKHKHRLLRVMSRKDLERFLRKGKP